MLKFTLEKIILRNVRCYGDEPMEMDFPTNNLTVFTGHVGAGKSTIVKAVSMALYGEDGGVKGEKLTIDDMVNEKNGKNLEIHLFFHSLDDITNVCDKYEIHLYHKHSKFSNKLVFIKNGNDISANGKIDTYRLIEKTLIPKQVYHNIYYFTQQAKNFFTALPNSEQKEIFDSILDLSEYDSYYENAKEIQSKLEDKLRNAESKRDIISERIESLNAANTEFLKEQENQKLQDKSMLENRTKQLGDIKKEKENKQCDLELISFSSEELQNKKNSLIQEKNKKVLDIDNQIERKMKELSDLGSSLKKKFESHKSQSTNEFQSLKFELEKEKMTLNEKIQIEEKNYLKKNQEISKKINNEVSENTSAIEKELNSKQKDTDKIQDRAKKLHEEKNDLLGKLDESYNSKLRVFEKEIAEKSQAVKSKQNDCERTRDELEKESKKLKDYENDLTNNSAVCRECGQPLTNKDHIRKHINKCKDTIEYLSVSISNFDSDISEVEDSLKKFISDKNTLSENYNNKKFEINQKYEQLIESERENYRLIKSSIMSLFNQKEDIYKNIKEKYSADIDGAESDRNQNIEIINKKISAVDAKITDVSNDFNEKLKSIKAQIEDEYKLESKNIKNFVTNLENEKNNTIESKSNEIHSVDMSIRQWNSIKMTLDEMDSNISYIEKEISRLKSIKYDMTYSDNIKSKIEENKVEKSKIEDEMLKIQKDIDIAVFWKQSFSNSGIKSMLIDSAIPHMNQCVHEELERVAPGMFTVSFDTLSTTKSGNIRDKFSINIVHNMKGSTGHKKLSGGEKRIVDLCCMTALRSLAENLYNKKFCHIFYDEILDSLDADCKEQFCRNAKLQSENGMNITLITHDLPDDVDPDRVFPF